MNEEKNTDDGWSELIEVDGLVIRTRQMQPGEDPKDLIPKEPEEHRQARMLADMYRGGYPPERRLFFGEWLDAVRVHEERGDPSMLARVIREWEEPLPTYARSYLAALLSGERELKRDGHIKMRETDVTLIQHVAADFWLAHELANSKMARSEKTSKIHWLAKMTGRPESTVRKIFNSVLNSITADSVDLKRKRRRYGVTRVVGGKKQES